MYNLCPVRFPGEPYGHCIGARDHRGRDSAEGFVHVHFSIHGSTDFDPSTADRRNPVAHISVHPAKKIAWKKDFVFIEKGCDRPERMEIGGMNKAQVYAPL